MLKQRSQSLSLRTCFLNTGASPGWLEATPLPGRAMGKRLPQHRAARAAPLALRPDLTQRSHTKCWAVTALGAHQQTPTQPVPTSWGHLGQSPHFSANNIRHDSCTLLRFFHVGCSFGLVFFPLQSKWEKVETSLRVWTLSQKKSSPGLENSLMQYRGPIYIKRQKFRTGLTPIEWIRLRDEFTLVIHTSVHVPDRGFCVRNAHFTSFYTSKDLKEWEAEKVET